ncbi:hypothetical protein I3843_09G170200 [Carya illinoinensis]|nr:hypothetical protein I3760_09G173600 [Carya illinoinensis]KAG6642926.1 hypothetical protein CIPAW_09G174500 [Carya illinoinensis]KAG6671079.1 hypothetical protein I3843_Q016800 [Carya illinoinensis]KAG6696968.1 hypothetical protein I3842_09G176100 [Carya illinoinensis]KAG7964429.1 hypothetical protein I3843_09G170200 [Carya illinoinensis]
MGYIVVISLPVILFILIVALAFYLLGRAQGRSQAARIPHYGPPAPPLHAPSPPQDKSAQV